MKRAIPALLVCALLGTSAQAQPDPVKDSRTVLALVAADAVRIYRAASTGLNCVQPTLSTTALDEHRRRRREALADPALRATYGPQPAEYDWRQSADYFSGGQSAPVASETRHLLSEAANAVISGEPPAQPTGRLESGWLTGVPFCGAGHARSVLSLSAPVIRGDIAFVETGYGCSGLCGIGYLYALRRNAGGGWAIAGVLWTWVS